MKKESSGYDPKKDLGAAVRFLVAILEKTRSMVLHLDTQTNILIGLSSGILLFAASRASFTSDGIFYLILATASACAAFIGLLAIHPPSRMRKHGQTESLMFNKKIMSFSTYHDYENELAGVLGDQEAMLREFSQEIYNISRYYYRPKRFLFHLARNFLLWGLALSFLSFLFRISF